MLSHADLQNFAKILAFMLYKLHLNRSSLRPKSSTVIHRWLFNQLTEIKFNGKAKEKSCIFVLLYFDAEVNQNGICLFCRV